jgi:hypothetical protein
MKRSGWLLLGAGLLAGCSQKPTVSAGCVAMPPPPPKPYLLRYYGPLACQPGRQYIRVNFDITTEGVFAGVASLSDADDYKDLRLSGKERPGPYKCFTPDPVAAASSPMTLDLRVRSMITDAFVPVLIRMPMAPGVSAILVEPVPGG